MTHRPLFYEYGEDVKRALLCNLQQGTTYISKNEGFSGAIYTFDRGDMSFPSRLLAAKIPKIKKGITAEGAAMRFLRELEIQQSMHYHWFVHWPLDFHFIQGAPVAWFRKWVGDLSDYIENPGFGKIARISMLAYIVSGIIHCHRRGLVCHQDFKPENIFINDLRTSHKFLNDLDVHRIPKIADFGSSNLARDWGIYDGTRAYMAPEQWNKRPLGQWTSAYAIGVIAYELISNGIHPIGEPSRPWRNGTNPQFNRWQRKSLWQRWHENGRPLPIPLENISLNEIIKSCLSEDPAQRPPLQEILDCLLEQIGIESSNSLYQVELYLDFAEDNRTSDLNWPYLTERFDKLKCDIASYFNI